MSAEAGSTGAEKMIDERASAAENALSCEAVDDCSWFGEFAWQTMVAILGLEATKWDPNLGVDMDLERFVGMVSDIFLDSEGEGDEWSVERWLLDFGREVISGYGIG